MASVPNDDAASGAASVRFADLRLAAPVLEALIRIGYESPSPIQARTIPPLLEGRDVLGQAQTGTGKTAAFALPILSMIDTSRSVTQALVLAPTRELAIQVAEALQNYASAIPGFHARPQAGCPRRRWHAGSGRRPHQARLAQARQPASVGARRSR
jgi:ATP-dependent RNA helicase DeaD